MKGFRGEGTTFRAAKVGLIALTAALDLTACALPGLWGRGGFFEGGDVIPGWALVFGFPCYCPFAWLPIAGLVVSGRWLWQGRNGRAFLLAAASVVPVAGWLALQQPGRLELRAGYYVCLSAHVLWAVGVGGLWGLDRSRGVPHAEADPFAPE
jgi:hypothetical protein